AQGCNARELETRRGRDYRGLGFRRRREEDLSARLEIAKALHPHRAATEGISEEITEASPYGRAELGEISAPPFSFGCLPALPRASCSGMKRKSQGETDGKPRRCRLSGGKAARNRQGETRRPQGRRGHG